MRDVDPMVLGIVFLLFAVLILPEVARSLWEGIASRGWPVVTGRIATSRVGKRQAGGRPTVSYPCLWVQYDYAVGSRTYAGTRWRVGYVNHFVRDDAEEWASFYQPGATVAVHHDPRRPERSVLETGPHASVYARLVIGLAGAVGGVLLVVLDS